MEDKDLTPAGLWLKKNRYNLMAFLAIIVVMFGSMYLRQHPEFWATVKAAFSPPPEKIAKVPPNVGAGNSTAPVLPKVTYDVPDPQVPPEPAVNAGSSWTASNECFPLASIPWNIMNGTGYANGGVTTQPGSLMHRHGVCLIMLRVDNYSTMQASLAAYAEAYAAGKPIPEGVYPAVVIMDNGSALFLQELNDRLRRLNSGGKDFTVVKVGPFGRSDGEDGMWGPKEIIANPQLLRGMVAVGVKGDGDPDIGLKYASEFGIHVNTDETILDRDSLNMMSKDDLNKVAKAFNERECDTRKERKNGVLTGNTVTACPELAFTWTPGDKAIATGRGGVVRIVSTKEYNTLMPGSMYVVHQWAIDNRSKVEGLLAASAEGGDAVNASDTALMQGSRVLHAVFSEAGTSPQYWFDNYKGARIRDAAGVMVDVGGSHSFGLAEMLDAFGLLTGSSNLVANAHDHRGDVMAAMYPELLPRDFVRSSRVMDPSFLKAVQARAKAVPQLEVAYSDQAPTKVYGNRSWSITFATGSAQLTPAGIEEIKLMAVDAEEARSLRIEIIGHTDNTGSRDANMALSQKRARAVQQYLTGRSSINFPKKRFVSVTGLGDTQPVADNSTEQGRAKNRRVQIKLEN